MIVAQSGKVWTIGASLNGIGRKTTTILSPIPGEAADALREFCEGRWESAELVGQSPPTEAAIDGGEGEAD